MNPLIQDNNISNNKPLPLVQFINGQFVIPSEAKALLSSIRSKNIGIISLVGKYRTGKSFLLNRVLLNQSQSQGFGVGPSIKPCTKGIWIWPKPVMIKNKNSREAFPCFFIDTEGLEAYDEEVNHDSKIFLIAILISSLFIFNSFGSINENAINSLNFVLNLSQTIKFRESDGTNGGSDSINEIIENFPTLIWLLRDFSLLLQDVDGNQITPKQYLEMALQDVKWSNKTDSEIIEKNKVRSLIRKYFPERDCFVMVRPVANEKDIQNLQHLPNNKLRPEFIKQAETFRRKVHEMIKPKTFMNKEVNGTMLIELIQNVVDVINKGKIPIIESSWRYVMQSECIRQLDDIVNQFHNDIMNFRNENENISCEDIKEYMAVTYKKYINKFTTLEFIEKDILNEYSESLKKKINREMDIIQKETEKQNEAKFYSEIENFQKTFINSFNQGKYLDKPSLFFDEITEYKETIDRKYRNISNKNNNELFDTILSIVQIYLNKVLLKEKEKYERDIEQYKRSIENYKNSYREKSSECNQLKNESLIELQNQITKEKIKKRNSEEKILMLLNEKKNMKESYERQLSDLKESYTSQIEKITRQKNEKETELHIKEEQLLVMKITNEKISNLNQQKYTYMQKEMAMWKDKYNKLLQDIKSKDKLYTDEISLLKAHNSSLKSEQNDISMMSYISSSNNDMSEMMTMVKENIKTLQSKEAENEALIHKLQNENFNLNVYKQIIEQTSTFKCKFCSEIYDINIMKKHIVECNTYRSYNKSTTFSMNSSFLSLTKNESVSPSQYKVSVINKKASYVIKVYNSNSNWSVSKTLNQCANLYKTLKSIFRGVIDMPQSGEFLININTYNNDQDCSSSLEQFINDLLANETILHSKPFKIFLDLDHH